LPVQFGEGQLQHLAMSGVLGSLQLLRQALPGQNQALTGAVALLLGCGKGRTSRLARLGHVLLLLFH